MAILASRTKTGISWVMESIALFKQAPRQWLLLALAFVGIFILLPALPGLQYITVLVWPAFIAIAIRLYRNVELNELQSLSTVIARIQTNIKPLLLLGAISLCYSLVVGIMLSADMQVLADSLEKQQLLTEQEVAVAAEMMMPILLKLVLIFIPLMIAVWFAPMLIAFNGYSLLKAIKSSIAGVLQYFVALLAAWLLLSAGMMALMMVSSLVFGMFVMIMPAIGQLVMSVMVYGCFLISIAMTLAFQYVSYRDIFRAA